MFPFATKRFIAKMGTRYRTLNFPRIKQWLMHGCGQFEEMLVAIFRVCSRHFKDSDYKTNLTGKRKPNNDAVSSIFVWKKSSPKKRKPLYPRETSKESVQNARKRKITKN